MLTITTTNDVNRDNQEQDENIKGKEEEDGER